MRFQKYSSIENSYRIEFIERIKFEAQDQGTWVVTEKIHGANFSIWVNKTRTRIAKRTSLLGNNDNFYGVGRIRDDLCEKVRLLYQGMKPRPKEIAVYGELFGGSYPHPKVLADPNAKKVQAGVWYSPRDEFMAYDLKVDGIFMDFKTTAYLFENVMIPVVPILYIGTFVDCLDFHNDHVSTVYKEYGLPRITGNIMEGVVIRPLNGDRYLKRGERVIIKSKNSKFAEISKHKAPRKVIKLTGISKEAVDRAMPLINVNRYNAVISKIGEVSTKDFGMILGLIIQDIHEELMKDTKFYINYQNLEKAERKLVHRIIAPEVATLIRAELLGIK